MYCDWHQFLLETFPEVHLDAIVYLRAEPAVSYARMGTRARDEESGVALDYLESIHDRHESWLVQQTTRCATGGETGLHVCAWAE